MFRVQCQVLPHVPCPLCNPIASTHCQVLPHVYWQFGRCSPMAVLPGSETPGSVAPLPPWQERSWPRGPLMAGWGLAIDGTAGARGQGATRGGGTGMELGWGG